MSIFTVVVLLGVALAAVTVGIWWKKSNIIELILFGILYWLCAWVITGMAFFVLDVFSLLPCAIGTVGLELAVGATVLLIRKKRDRMPWKNLMRVSWDIRQYWILILICAGGVVLVSMKHELFGMGQDEGVYQTVAIQFLNGITNRQQDFAEYHTLSAEQQELFQKSVHSYLVGYDIPSEDYPDTVYDRSVSPVSGIFHGIPTYASMLAMWGKIFGMAQMQGIQTLFYGCTIFLVYFLCQNLKLRRSSTVLACAISAASPVVVWVAKSALTESFLSVLIVLFLYFLTDDAHSQRQWMSILPVAVFSCFHVSIYTILPLFVVLYGGMFWLTRRKSFAILVPLSIVIYCISFFAMRHVQPFYTMNNYSPLFGLGISQANLPVLIPVVCAAAVILSVGILWLIHRLIHQRYRDMTTASYLACVRQSRFGVILVECLLVLLVLYIAVRCIMAEQTLSKLHNSAFWGFVCSTGFVLLPAAWIVGVIRPRFYLESSRNLVILVAAFYCVLFYSAFLRFDVKYYYYYGRYLVPFIPVAVTFAAMTLDRFRANMAVPLTIVGLLFVSPYDGYLLNHVDDTRMQWSVLEETASKINSDDCIIVSSADMWTMYLPLRAMTGAAAYPLMGDLEEQAKELDQIYDHVFYLGSGKWSDSFAEQFQLVYMNSVTQSLDKSESAENRNIIDFQLKYSEQKRTVMLYEYWQEQLSYTAESNSGKDFSGFNALQGNFCWTNSEDASVHCYLSKQDYTMMVELGAVIPLREIGCEEYVIDVLVNQELVGKLYIDDTSNGGSLSINIPASALHSGINTITLHSELWPAAVVNESDTRYLGIPLQGLEFEAA